MLELSLLDLKSKGAFGPRKVVAREVCPGEVERVHELREPVLLHERLQVGQRSVRNSMLLRQSRQTAWVRRRALQASVTIPDG